MKIVVINDNETVIGSILKDVVSIGMVFLLLLANYKFFTGRWYIDIFCLFIFFVFVLNKGSSDVNKFKSVDEAITFLEKQKEDEQD